MSIIISKDGFLGNISSSNGDIFIETQNNTKTITIAGVQQYTGSIIRDLDRTTGNLVKSKERKSDGTWEEIKYDPSIAGKKIETKVKDPTKGKEYIRSGSATANQIEFHQSAVSAFINVSGSDPGFNVFNTVSSAKSTIRGLGSYISSGSGNHDYWSYGMSRYAGNFYIARSMTQLLNQSLNKYEELDQFFMISKSGDVHIKGGKLIAEEYIVSSSVTNVTTLAQSGSTQFGDTGNDTHTFTGHITASANISASGNANVIGRIYGKTINDITTNNINMMTDNRIDLNPNNAVALRLTDSSVTMNKDTNVNGHITASGNISSSGTITANSYGAVDATSVTVSGNINANGNIVGDDGTNITNISYIKLDTIKADSTDYVNIGLNNSGMAFNVADSDNFSFNSELFANADFHYYDSDEEIIFQIDQSAKKVGIGAIGGAPTNTLHVDGDVRINSDITASGHSVFGNSSADTHTFTGHITASGDISGSGIIYGKQKDIKNSAFFLSSNHTSANFIPLAGSTSEGTTDQYYHTIIAGYKGRLVKVFARTVTGDPGTLTIGFHTGSGAYNASLLQSTPVQEISKGSTVDDIVYTFHFSSSHSSFNETDLLGVSVKQSTSNNGSYTITSVWEYDIND